MLIGMDIITKGDFSISHFEGKTCFSFRVPSVQEMDFVEEHRKTNSTPIHSLKVSRNSPCPCGSGKKYKQCCA
jgi:preprotein translocase subunit SecA